MASMATIASGDDSNLRLEHNLALDVGLVTIVPRWHQSYEL